MDWKPETCLRLCFKLISQSCMVRDAPWELWRGVVRLVLDNRRTCTIFLFTNDLCSLRTGFNGLVRLVFAPIFVNYVNTSQTSSVDPNEPMSIKSLKQNQWNVCYACNKWSSPLLLYLCTSFRVKSVHTRKLEHWYFGGANIQYIVHKASKKPWGLQCNISV